MLDSDTGPVRYEWRGAFSNQEVNALHAEAFDHRLFADDWDDLLSRLSLGWVAARDDQGIVGFVNRLGWPGPRFCRRHRRSASRATQGVGVRLIRTAREHAAATGCKWLHVDFEDGLRDFYYNACGFTPTNAGLIQLR